MSKVVAQARVPFPRYSVERETLYGWEVRYRTSDLIEARGVMDQAANLNREVAFRVVDNLED